jgi:hypothetical protein
MCSAQPRTVPCRLAVSCIFSSVMPYARCISRSLSIWLRGDEQGRGMRASSQQQQGAGKTGQWRWGANRSRRPSRSEHRARRRTCRFLRSYRTSSRSSWQAELVLAGEQGRMLGRRWHGSARGLDVLPGQHCATDTVDALYLIKLKWMAARAAEKMRKLQQLPRRSSVLPDAGTNSVLDCI